MTNTLITKQNGQYGLRTIEGKVVLDATFKNMKYLNQERYAVKNDGLWAVIDSDGNFLTDYIYKDVDKYYNDRAVVSTNMQILDSKKLIDLLGRELDIEYKEDIIEWNRRYDRIIPTKSDDRYIANMGSIYRLLDKDGKFVNAGQEYKILKPINENLYLSKKLGQKAIINDKHEIIFKVPEKFMDIYHQMSNGMYQVTTNSNYSGYLDAEGNEVIPSIYYAGYEFSKDTDLAFVTIDEEKGGYINSKNEFIIEPIYEFGNVFTNGVASVKKDGVWFIINEKGEKISDDFSKVSSLSSGFASVVLLNGDKVVVDTSGEIVFSYPEDTEIGYFINNLATITRGGKVGLINSEGEILVEPKYEEVSISDVTDIHKFKENGLYGYINSLGKVLLNPIFRKAEHFGKNGSVIVEKGESTYLIQNFGERIAEIDVDFSNQWTSSEFGESEVAAVRLDTDRYIFVDSYGNTVGQTYEFASSFYNGQAIVNLPSKYEVIDKNGNVVDTSEFTIAMEEGEIILESNE